MDRNSSAFFTNRQAAIEQRIDEIKASPTLLESYAQYNYDAQMSLDSIEIDWTLFTGWDQIQVCILEKFNIIYLL